MTHMFRLSRAPILAVGLLMALCGAARCNDPAESSRESIIQGVRDDVRRHIREEQMRQAGKRSQSAEVSQATIDSRAVKRRKQGRSAARE